MPLHALLDGERVIAPSFPDDEWVELRQAARDGVRDLRLTCCRERAFQRTSFRGLKHFYHPARIACDQRGETLQHQGAKLAILGACREAGWEGELEVAGDGWRADVLAERNEAKVAFEVQWSRTTLDSLLLRQERYRLAGIRGCWLARSIPTGFPRTPDQGRILARRDLPLFLLEVDGWGQYWAFLNGWYSPLDAFVQMLLAGEIQFRERLTAPRDQSVKVRFFQMRCRRCGRPSHVWTLEQPEYTSHCGLPIPLARSRAGKARAGLRAEILREVKRFLERPESEHLRPATIRERTSPAGYRHRYFACRACGAAFADEAVWERETYLLGGDLWHAELETVVQVADGFGCARPHWCDGHADMIVAGDP